MSKGAKGNKGQLDAAKLYAVIIESDATDKALIDCYNDIKKHIRKEQRLKHDSSLRKGIDGRTS